MIISDTYKDYCREREYQAHLNGSNLHVARLNATFAI